MLGISVVICCHNSAKELPQTLAHLAAQQVEAEISWEVIVVDNASTDNTPQVAKDSWLQVSLAPLRIVAEPKLGLIYARYRGLAAAKYEIISFIDDDNWVCPNWVQTASEVMSQHPEIGACGGLCEAQPEVELPFWFERNQNGYAVGSQGPEKGGDITWSRGRLRGAGLTIRKAAWQQMVDEGFRSLLVGCQGKALSRGEDIELCYALILAGWHLWYEPRLKLSHFLGRERLRWQYLRKLKRGGGAATLGLDPYLFVVPSTTDKYQIPFWWNNGNEKMKQHRRQTWHWQALLVLKDLLRRPRKLLFSRFRTMEGDVEVLKIEIKIGRLIGLLQKRQEYDRSIQEIKQAAWRKSRQFTESESIYR